MILISDIVSECSAPALSILLLTARKILDFIRIIVPILLIISLTMTFIQLMSNPEEKKLKGKIKNQALAAVIVFFIPTFLNAVMGILGSSFTLSACWNMVPDLSTQTNYISPTTVNRKTFIITSEEYEKGVERPKSTTSSGEVIEGKAQQIGDVVWDSSDVTRISNLTSTQLVGILNAYGGNAKNFVPYASNLITAENKYSVNVFFLLGVEALESGWVTSPISRNCNNLGGVCASSEHPSNGCGRNYNCSFAHFDSVGDFIDHHAKMLHNNYLTPGGPYYHGTSPSAVVTNYCPGCSDWPGIVTNIANGLFNKTSSVL